MRFMEVYQIYQRSLHALVNLSGQSVIARNSCKKISIPYFLFFGFSIKIYQLTTHFTHIAALSRINDDVKNSIKYQLIIFTCFLHTQIWLINLAWLAVLIRFIHYSVEGTFSLPPYTRLQSHRNRYWLALSRVRRVDFSNSMISRECIDAKFNTVYCFRLTTPLCNKRNRKLWPDMSSLSSTSAIV